MAMMLPIIIAAKVIGPLIANVENALTPWPIEQPIAITLPNPIKTAPNIWRPNSRASSSFPSKMAFDLASDKGTSNYTKNTAYRKAKSTAGRSHHIQ